MNKRLKKKLKNKILSENILMKVVSITEELFYIIDHETLVANYRTNDRVKKLKKDYFSLLIRTNENIPPIIPSEVSNVIAEKNYEKSVKNYEIREALESFRKYVKNGGHTR